MRRRSLGVVALVACLSWLGPAVAPAQQARSIHVDVMVSQIFQEPGPIDPRASRLDAQLRGEFRYESLRVLQQKRLTLALNELGRLSLPNGSELQLRPLSLSDRGVLMAVAVQGSVQSDMQIPSGHLVAIGAGQFEGGKLVISLEPHF